MTIGGEETNAIVFYDKDTMELFAMVTDEDIVIPENCEVAQFSKGREPIFRSEPGSIKLIGALLKNGAEV